MDMLLLNQLQLPPPKHWQDFENLAKDLFREAWGDFQPRSTAGGASAAGGGRLWLPLLCLGWAGVQCKDKDLLIRASLTIDELRAEVRKARSFQPPLTQFIIATTAPRDARLQAEARTITERHRRRGLFSVHVYGWEDVTEMLGNHPRVFRRYYGSLAGVETSATSPLFPEEAMAAAFHAEERVSDVEDTPPEPLVLPAHAIHALGILATSPVPLPEKAYPFPLPAIRWKEEVRGPSPRTGSASRRREPVRLSAYKSELASHQRRSITVP